VNATDDAVSQNMSIPPSAVQAVPSGVELPPHKFCRTIDGVQQYQYTTYWLVWLLSLQYNGVNAVPAAERRDPIAPGVPVTGQTADNRHSGQQTLSLVPFPVRNRCNAYFYTRYTGKKATIDIRELKVLSGMPARCVGAPRFSGTEQRKVAGTGPATKSKSGAPGRALRYTGRGATSSSSSSSSS
jgi:hypothetical protein